MDAAEIKTSSVEMFETYLRPKIFSEAVSEIQEHKQQGMTIVLVTGSLDFIVQPIADYLAVDAVLAPQLREENGQFTGELTTVPLIGERKAEAMQEFRGTTRNFTKKQLCLRRQPIGFTDVGMRRESCCRKPRKSTPPEGT